MDRMKAADRLRQTRTEQETISSLVGSYCLCDKRGWQGYVVGEPAPGTYLVQLFSWVSTQATGQVLVPVAAMTEEQWLFFDDADEWRERGLQMSKATLDRLCRDEGPPVNVR